jgi:TRAP-type C4-dicarboxylate transport system permease small subunit
MRARLKAVLGRLLETVVVTLVLTLTAVVVVAVIYRKAGASLSWYDEVASVLLAWVTYYGAALAALKRQHIGFDGLVRSVPPAWRLAFVVVSEIAVIGFFGLLAWTGWIVLEVLEGDTLISLPWVPIRLTQSVIPIGAVLFIICEVVSLPDYWRDLREGTLPTEVAAHIGPKP